MAGPRPASRACRCCPNPNPNHNPHPSPNHNPNHDPNHNPNPNVQVLEVDAAGFKFEIHSAFSAQSGELLELKFDQVSNPNPALTPTLP